MNRADGIAPQTIAVVRFFAVLGSVLLVQVIGNYCMDVHLKGWEVSFFPLSTDYDNKTQYALIAQSAERI
jgi:hypothetical protein